MKKIQINGGSIVAKRADVILVWLKKLFREAVRGKLRIKERSVAVSTWGSSAINIIFLRKLINFTFDGCDWALMLTDFSRKLKLHLKVNLNVNVNLNLNLNLNFNIIHVFDNKVCINERRIKSVIK
jgi:hypothetical protein